MGVPFSAEAVRLQRVPQGNMQIALETKPEKPATGPEGVEPGTKVEVTSLARSTPTLGACDSDPKFWLGMELSDRTFCLVHTRAPSTGGGSDRRDGDLDPAGPAASASSLPARPHSGPAAPLRPRPVPPAQPQGPDLPGWAGRTATSATKAATRVLASGRDL